MDFSCYCFIDVYGSPAPLTLTGKGDTHGRWEHSPVHTLDQSEYAWNGFQLKDNFGFFGSEGWVEYGLPDGTKFKMSFSCPTGYNNNKASITCTGPSCGQFSYNAQLTSGCAPANYASPNPLNPDDCNANDGASAVSGHPVMAFFNLTGPNAQLQPRSPKRSPVPT